jgi:PAS domain S-box-containing protein
LLGPDLFELNRPYVLAALAGQVQTFERIIPGPDGVQRHSLASYLPDIVDGQVRGFAAHVTEVTTLKQTQQDLSDIVRRLEGEVQRRIDIERDLLDTQQNLFVTLASIDGGFLATDREGRIITMNSVAERTTGWTLAEARGRQLWEVFQHEDRPPHYVGLNPVDVYIDLGLTVDAAHNIMLHSRDGRRVPLETKAAVTRNREGEARGLAIVFRDVTRLRAAEADSRRLAAIIESSGDAIIGKTLDGRITSWNGAAEGMFGYSAAEALGQSIRMLIPPERLAEEMRFLTDIAQGVGVTTFDTQRIAKLGHRVDVSLSISPIRDDRGTIVGASKIARDVSAKRRVERELQASESRLRFTVEAAGVGVWELDLASGVFVRSPQHDLCFGHRHPLPAWTLDDLKQSLHADDRDEVMQHFRPRAAKGLAWNAECRVLWPDASVHWISLHGRPDEADRNDGGVPKMRGVVFDITARKLQQEERLRTHRLEAENRQIQEASRLKSLFLANMSHELRTPLNAIIGFADLLHRGTVPPSSPKHHAFLGHIASSGRHLLQLINDVLDLAKVESGKLEFFPAPIDLPLLVTQALDTLQVAVERRDIQVSVDIEPGLDGLFLDPSRLKQVLYNYLSNAIKFTPESGHVTVRACSVGPHHFRLEVEDDGIGIAPAGLERLFADFQQLDSGYSKQHQGTGLGLALTRRLVHAQGGEVGVRSTLGQGSVFHVQMNRVHGTDPPVDAATPPHRVGMDRCRLLLIEPIEQVQGRLVQGLAEAGFDVDTAPTAQHALQCSSSRHYDGLTLDLSLPDGDGLGLLARLREHGGPSQVPVLGLTVPGSDGGAAAFGIANILNKPLDVDEVASAMRHLRRTGGAAVTVMVIDDEPTALQLMHAALGRLGIEANCFDDGRQALAQLEQRPPAAIVLDLMMPGFNGFEVLDAVRRMPAAQHIPVYIWTSMLLTRDEYLRLARSAQGILAKGGGAVSALLASLVHWRASVDTRQTDTT